jgi:molybdopterin molybdotransferase
MTADRFAPPVSLDEALAAVDAALAPRQLASETVAPGQALGRTLAADALSRLDLPPFNKSAMDGYAVGADDPATEFRVLETVPAGKMPTQALSPGAASKVMTGAAVPQGAGKVIMIEDTESDGDMVRVLKDSGKPNICLQGEDVRVGDVVLGAGTELGPLEVANLVGCGLDRLEVRPRVRIAVLSTGDEIVDHPDQLAPGKIMNSNGPLLAGLAQRCGMDVVRVATLPDQREATIAGLREAADAADLVVLSGGVSVGDYDFVLESFAEAGMTLHFSRVAVKPGKPTTFATGAGGVAFGLPGNPASVYLMFHLFVLRAARLLTGAPHEPRLLELPLGFDYRRRKTKRRQYVPARIGPAGALAPVEFHGSAHLLALTRADGFFVMPEGVGEAAAGQTVTFLPTSGGLR